MPAWHHSEYATPICPLTKSTINKRAQRALGRSPEKKGKGNSGANYREHYRGII